MVGRVAGVWSHWGEVSCQARQTHVISEESAFCLGYTRNVSRVLSSEVLYDLI